MIDDLVKEYYQLIRGKAQYLYDPSSFIHRDKADYQDMMRKMSNEEIFRELEKINNLQTLIFRVISTGDHGHLKYKLCQHIFMIVLYSFLKLYTVNYLIIIHLLGRSKSCVISCFCRYALGAEFERCKMCEKILCSI